jgi:hypothetical protein
MDHFMDQKHANEWCRVSAILTPEGVDRGSQTHYIVMYVHVDIRRCRGVWWRQAYVYASAAC